MSAYSCALYDAWHVVDGHSFMFSNSKYVHIKKKKCTKRVERTMGWGSRTVDWVTADRACHLFSDSSSAWTGAFCRYFLLACVTAALCFLASQAVVFTAPSGGAISSYCFSSSNCHLPGIFLSHFRRNGLFFSWLFIASPSDYSSSPFFPPVESLMSWELMMRKKL